MDRDLCCRQQRDLKIAAAVRSEKYYVNMMIAWFFATALAKQWDSAVVYIENGELGPWVHKKDDPEGKRKLSYYGRAKAVSAESETISETGFV